MKKSAQVPASMIVALAATLATGGCGSQRRECQDASGRVLPDSACVSGTPGAHWFIQRNGFGGGYSSGGYYSGGSFGS